MATHPHRPPKRPPEQGIQKDGLFTGTAQSGQARRQRAHALAEELLARGCMFIKKRVWDEAAAEFRKALQMEADYPEAYNNLGLCLLYMKKYGESIEAFTEALRLFAGWHIAEANLGLACALSGRNEEAAKHYEKSLAIQEQPALWLSLGDVYAALGNLDKAAEAFKKALAGNPRSSAAYQHLGLLEARRNNLEECEVALRKAVELDSGNVEAWAVLGAAAARKGQLAKARGFFEKSAQAEKLPAPAQRGVHRLEVFGAGLEKALAEWKAGMPEPPPLANCYYNLGLAQSKAGAQAAAKESFQKAAEMDPAWAEPLIWSAFLEALEGDGVSARKQLETARELQTDDGLVRELLGYLAVAMGLQKEAEANFALAAKRGRTIPQEHVFPDQPAATPPPLAGGPPVGRSSGSPGDPEGRPTAEPVAESPGVCPMGPDDE